MIRCTACIVGLALASSSAAAAPLYGQKSEPLAVEAMANFGQCVARTTPAGARKLLAMDFRTKDYAQAIDRLASGHGRCAPGSRIGFNGVLFAGALAEAMLESEHRPEALPGQIARHPSRPRIEARSSVETMALCTVMAEPQVVADLFATLPASSEEAVALKGLAPTLGACLAQGQSAAMNRPGLRSVLALAAWRLATHNAGAAASSKEAAR